MVKKVKSQKLLNESVFDYGSRKNLSGLGSTGTDIVGGRFGEEYLSKLRGSQASDEYDKMRRGEAQIAMLLLAVKNPILASNISFEAPEENVAAYDKARDLVAWNFNDGFEHGKEQFLTEALTVIDKGHSIFERIDGVINHPELGTVNYIKSLAFRKQNTINKWNLAKGTGNIISVEQVTSSDTAKDTIVEIPGDFLVVFTNQKEGDNYEGISMLRPMYGAYLRKDLYLKLGAMGLEKYSVGIPIATSPEGKKQTPAEMEQLKAILGAYISHEAGYIIKPAGWEIDIKFGQFDATKVADFIKLENQEMINAAVANFLALGMSGGGGSYSLASDLSDFFLAGLQAYANTIANVYNRRVIPAQVRMNYGAMPKFPKMCITGINDKAGKELAEVILSLTNSGSLRPDDKLEDYLRQQYRMPKADTATTRSKTASPTVDPNNPTPPPEDKKEVETELNSKEQSIQLADNYKKNFSANAEMIKPIMQTNLRAMADSLKKQLATNWKTASDANKLSAGKGVSCKGVPAYKADLKKSFTDIANQAVIDVKKELPQAKKVKFQEAMTLAEFDKLNPKVKRLILAQMNLIAETQAADLEKTVLFQFASSAASQTDLDAILNDIESRVAPIIEGTTTGINVNTAANNAVAQITQGTRNEFFFEPEVLEQIESFEFVNDDPVSEICQNLNGQTFLPTDKDAEQFYPPLHHNCKSRIVANGKGEGKKVTGLNILANTTAERERLEKLITLCEHGPLRLFEA